MILCSGEGNGCGEPEAHLAEGQGHGLRLSHMGAALVILSWLILLLAATGTTPIDQDATAAVLLLPPEPVRILHARSFSSSRASWVILKSSR